MNVFIDTEFTSLSDPRLLSIGAVACESRYFYGVVDDVPHSACSSFVVKYVLPLLDARQPDVRGPHDAVARAFAAWLAALPDASDGNVLLMDDECDRELLRRLIHTAGWRDGAVPECQLMPLANGTREAAEFQGWFAADGERHRHNALDDAFAYRYAVVLKQDLVLGPRRDVTE